MRPILFLHGFNALALPEDCKKDWATMEASFSAQGFTGPMVTFGYYYNDPNCDAMITMGTIFDPIEKYSKAYAWMVYNTYSAKGISVDMVTHSMGGLITRYAMYRTSIGDPEFPPFLKISHVTAIAAPFEGYSALAFSCVANAVNVPCWEMSPISPFILNLRAPAALTPQGADGTVWSNVGSNAMIIDMSDGFVMSHSATSQPIPKSNKMIMPWYKLVFHMMYTHNKTVIQFVAKTLGMGDAKAERTISSVANAVAEVTERPDVSVSRQRVLQDLSQLAANELPARIDPNLVNGEQSGVSLSSVLAGGIFDQMGLQNGDIIRGCSADTVNQAFENLSAMETSGQNGKLKLCVERNGANFVRVVAIN